MKKTLKRLFYTILALTIGYPIMAGIAIRGIWQGKLDGDTDYDLFNGV